MMVRGRPPKPRPPAAMAELERFAGRYRPKAEKLERQLDELRAQRDEAIRAAAAARVPLVDIAAIVGLTHQRVSKIIRGG
jgi:50S ribosomal subunit-associated GTPase HflX